MVSRSPNEPSFFPSQVFLEDLSTRISRQSYETWFRGTPVDFIPPNRLVISVPSRFHQSWLESNFKEAIRLSVQAVCNFDPEIEFKLPGSRTPGRKPPPPRRPAQRSKKSPGQDPPSPGSFSGSPVRSDFIFANLVAGPSNRFAHAAAFAASESEKPTYNPLLIQGPTGLGKTFILQACFQKMVKEEGRRAIYFTGEDLSNRIHAALKERAAKPFRNQLRDFDCLLVDDIQFLSDRRSLQEELLLILDDFLGSGRQVIFSSNVPPKDIAGISETLLSRFKPGLIANLDPPNLEMRIQLLKRKAAVLGIELPERAAEALAREIRGNPRELEGSLLQLVNILKTRDTDASLLEVIPEFLATLRDSAGTREPGQRIPIGDIQRAVAAYYKLKAVEIQSSCREKSLVFARQVGMYLARKLTDHSLEEIGGFFGGRDHATVIHSVRKIEMAFSSQAGVRKDIETILSRLQHG